MFDLDVGKLMLVGLVALIVVGPKDLPRALRLLGRVVGQMRRMRSTVRSQVGELMKEVDLAATKKELDAIDRSAHIDIAVNPRTAMRGHLPSAEEACLAASASPEVSTEATYASSAMREYLAPSSELRAAADSSPIVGPATKVEAGNQNFEAAHGGRNSTDSTLASSAA